MSHSGRVVSHSWCESLSCHDRQQHRGVVVPASAEHRRVSDTPGTCPAAASHHGCPLEQTLGFPLCGQETEA